ncbi:putative short-chain dehydrogenase [Xylaria cf. heliscus]|nr:putative short-chain dehydrogenase [Xylaria cf. heliscus]
MSGSIILTGANGSAGIHAAEHLLKVYHQYNAIFTVRNASDEDPNTQKLRQVISRYPDSHASIHQLDLASLSEVHDFASKLSSAFTTGQFPPLKAIICNAFYWDLVHDSELTMDNYDKTIQIGHISHVALVLRLIGNYAPDGGRIVLISSVAHFRKKTHMSPFLPDLPTDLDELLRPAPDKDKQGRGFQRYGNAKLLATTWMYPLNSYLLQNHKYQNITVVATNPGGLGDSRCFRNNTPGSIQFMSRFILKPLIPLINRLADPTFRSAAEAGADMVELAVNAVYEGERGYFTLLNKDQSDPLSLDKDTQIRVWKKSAEWAWITKDNTPLNYALE